MKYNKIKICKFICGNIFLVGIIFVSIFFHEKAIAEEQLEEEVEYIEYEFPYKEPELLLSGGYRFVDQSGSKSVNEFEYLHNSITLGSEIRVITWPQRIHLDLDIRNKNDFFSELRYSFKDLIYIRGMSRSVFHNLDNLRLFDLDKETTPFTSPSGPTVNVTDRDKEYGIKTNISNMFLRFKAPDFASHLFVDLQLINKEGEQQQRILLGSGGLDKIIKTTRAIDINSNIKGVTVGFNSHLGPIEIEVSHGEKKFDEKGDKIFFDRYEEIENSIRKAGLFPNSLIPEIKNSTNSIRLHTSYTGKLVASASLFTSSKENKESGASVDYLIASGEVMWMPITKLTFFLRYRHKEKDIDEIGDVPFSKVCDPSNNSSNNYLCTTINPMATKKDTISWTVRYRLINGLTLRGQYVYDEENRKNADEWGLPGSTKKEVLSLAADAKLFKSISLKAGFTHKEIKNPAYNSDPDSSNELKFSAIFMPFKKVQALLSYAIAKEKRDNIIFKEQDSYLHADGRDLKKEQLIGNIIFLISPKVSIVTNASLFVNDVRQDVFYRNINLNPINTRSDYKDRGYNYSIDLNYYPKENLSFDASVGHTIINGKFIPSDPVLTEPISITDLSKVRAKETTCSTAIKYQIKNGLSIRFRYKYTDLDETIKNPYNEIKDGKSHIFLLSISKNLL
jgi:predicted porin